MDSSFTIRPAAGSAASRALRDPVPVREAVATELVGGRAVAAAGDRRGAKDERAADDRAKDERAKQDGHAPHDLLADAESRDLIYRERDVGAAEREHPDSALLLRAYRPAPRAGDDGPDDKAHADIRA